MRRNVSKVSILDVCELIILLGQAGGMDRPFRQVMQNLAPTMREMKEYVGQLNVGQDAYTKLLGVYVELEEDRR